MLYPKSTFNFPKFKLKKFFVFFLLVFLLGCEEEQSGLRIKVYTKDATQPSLNNGKVYVEVDGGTPPYAFYFSDSPNNGDFGYEGYLRQNLTAGDYTVLITDATGLIDSAFFKIDEIIIPKPVIESVSIPSGTFTMGSPDSEALRGTDEGPQRLVTITGFKMSKYEVTFAQFDAFCDATGREKPDDNGWGRGNRPVINVNWGDAVAFAQWLGPGFRLPTEAEWEYACRAGTTTPFNTGSCLSSSQANFHNNFQYSSCPTSFAFQGKTISVGSYEPNAWGLYDMHGNVYEWCSDWYGPYLGSIQADPSGPTSGSRRIARGGCWDFLGSYCRSADRSDVEPSNRNTFIGFRLVVPS
jgi:sulfatase modifying factor 1